MIRHLQRKFILAAGSSLLIVLALILGIALSVSFHTMTRDADNILSILAENDGHFPKPFEEGRSDVSPDSLDARTERPEQPASVNSHDSYALFPSHSPELPFESRYFSVLFSADGTVSSIDTGKIAAVDSSLANEYADNILNTKKTKGFYKDYRFLVYQNSDHTTRVLFLDQSRSLGQFKNFFKAAVIISAAGLLLVIFLLTVLSRKIVAPIIESYEKQRRFITDAGHELKTPLAIIDADVAVIEMEQGEGEWTDDIKKQTKRLAFLTSNLIYLAKMEEQKEQMVLSVVCVSSLLDKTSDSFTAPAVKKGQRIHKNIAPDIYMNAGSSELESLFCLLIDNAVSHAPENDEICIALERRKRTICLEITNTAPDLSADDPPRLFDRFFKTDRARSGQRAQGSGYGIGLAAAKAITEAHKGKIHASLHENSRLKISAVFHSPAGISSR